MKKRTKKVSPPHLCISKVSGGEINEEAFAKKRQFCLVQVIEVGKITS